MAALKLGTRGSPLALYQARAVAQALGGGAVLVVIMTTGDRVQSRPLREVGGKGLFTKEIEDALLDGRIDLAVHSAKDMPTRSRPGLGLAATLPRADPRDVLISAKGGAIAALRKGAIVGTTSLRRQAQILRRRPDLALREIRGNVGTRLGKLAQGDVDALVLARAGLDRLAMAPAGLRTLSRREMLPAAGQGIIAIETRTDDRRTRAALRALDHAPTTAALRAERAFLAALDGSCNSPIAGHLALIEGGRARFAGMALAPDGSECYAATEEGPAGDAVALARRAAARIRAAAPEAFRTAYLSGE